MIKKILVTGFGSYDMYENNPSEMLVNYLHSMAPNNFTFDIHTSLLSVEYRKCENELNLLLNKLSPDVVLSFGLGFSKEVLTIERVALNIDDGSCGNGGAVDNASERRDGTIIAKDGPVGYWASVPVRKIKEEAELSGISTKLSNDAGSFVCNHVFYYLSHMSAKHLERFQVGFFHFPPLREDAKKWGMKIDGCEFSQVIVAFKAIIRALECQNLAS